MSPSSAPTPSAGTPDSNSGSDDDDDNVALAVGLSVPLALLSLFCLVYFTWYRNSCGFFEESNALKAPLVLDEEDDSAVISKETGSSNV